jgi:aminocarboxymuconate-semialdehyde decarboxylase
MYTDTVSPHALGVKFAVDYYGVDNVLYGSDYPCWNPTDALRVFEEAGLSEKDAEQVLFHNVRRLFGITDEFQPQAAKEAREPVAV